jgi:hypothetical protein
VTPDITIFPEQTLSLDDLTDVLLLKDEQGTVIDELFW